MGNQQTDGETKGRAAMTREEAKLELTEQLLGKDPNVVGVGINKEGISILVVDATQGTYPEFYKNHKVFVRQTGKFRLQGDRL